jgi:acyl carrier protein
MNDKVIEILNEIRPEFDFSEPVDDFIEAGMLDSFDVVTLVTTLDEEFGISIDGVDILPENFSSVLSITDLLSRYTQK